MKLTGRHYQRKESADRSECTAVVRSPSASPKCPVAAVKDALTATSRKNRSLHGSTNDELQNASNGRANVNDEFGRTLNVVVPNFRMFS
jgi:hypothetical protein